MKTEPTPIWKIAQTIRILDQQIADLQARRKRLLATLDQRKKDQTPCDP